MKQLGLLLMLVVAIDHLFLDAVLFETTTERLLGERKRLF